MSNGALADGLRQYVMYIYNSYLSDGLNIDQASKRVAKILHNEMQYFLRKENSTDLATLTAKLEQEKNEQERYKLVKKIDELNRP